MRAWGAPLCVYEELHPNFKTDADNNNSTHCWIISRNTKSIQLTRVCVSELPDINRPPRKVAAHHTSHICSVHLWSDDVARGALLRRAHVVVLVLVIVSVQLLRKPKYADDDHIFTSSRHGVTLDSTDDHALTQWRIDAEELLPIRRIAMRPYGSIWLANYLSETVIVKRINQKNISAKAQQDFIRRLSILAKLNHPNILRLIGVAWTTEVDVQIVVEYMSTGNLRRYLTELQFERHTGRHTELLDVLAQPDFGTTRTVKFQHERHAKHGAPWAELQHE